MHLSLSQIILVYLWYIYGVYWKIFAYLFLSSLGDLLFSKLFPFLLLVLVSLELGLTVLAVLDLLILFGFLDALLLLLLFSPIANLTFWELAGLLRWLVSLTGGALAIAWKIDWSLSNQTGTYNPWPLFCQFSEVETPMTLL